MDIVWSSMSSASRSAVSSPATWPRPGIATNRARPSAAASVAAAGGGWTGSAGASTTSVGTVTEASSAPRAGATRWVCAVTGSSVPAWAIARSWRARNAAAIALYADFGFRQVAVRKGYYAGREDALIMECELEAAGPSKD